MELTQQLYAYLNWRAKGERTTIHLAGCGHCNHGKGKNRDATEDNGRWIGPFATVEEAERSGRAARPETTVFKCQVCNP